MSMFSPYFTGMGIAIVASFIFIRDYEVLCDMITPRHFGDEKDI